MLTDAGEFSRFSERAERWESRLKAQGTGKRCVTHIFMHTLFLTHTYRHTHMPITMHACTPTHTHAHIHTFLNFHLHHQTVENLSWYFTQRPVNDVVTVVHDNSLSHCVILLKNRCN